jgi:hypothetical protein
MSKPKPERPVQARPERPAPMPCGVASSKNLEAATAVRSTH